MHDYSQRLGDAVKRARESQGLTQTELAEKISVAPRTILNIENYKGNPKLEIFALVIRALQIDPCYIFYPKKDPSSANKRQLELQLSDCTDAELEVLIPACRTILATLRAIQDNKSK